MKRGRNRNTGDDDDAQITVNSKINNKINATTATEKDLNSSAELSSKSKIKSPDPPNNLCTIDSHPLTVGHYIVVKYRDGSNRLSKIVERSEMVNESGNWSYYIHYNDFNRRMDEWISVDRIITYPSEANKLNVTTIHHQVHINSPNGNDEKKSITNNVTTTDKSGPTTVNELEHNEHEGLDEASLIEHEEVTKIKNIKFVQLGNLLYLL